MEVTNPCLDREGSGPTIGLFQGIIVLAAFPRQDKSRPGSRGFACRKEGSMAKKEEPRLIKANTICPNENCRFEHNREDALFCALCGIMLDLECAYCLDNPPYSRFCMYCGKDIGKDKADDVNL
jgi:hypothetical protein